MSITKKHINIYIVADKTLEAHAEASLEFALALNSIRARCYSSNIANAESFDWELRNNINSAAINSCDTVVVVGNDVTKEIEDLLMLVSKANKEIYCFSSKMRKKLRAKKFNVSSKTLEEKCLSLMGIS